MATPPGATAAAVATFFVSVTPAMHDFWNSDEPDERRPLLYLPKNTGLLGEPSVYLTSGRRRG